MTTAFEAIRSLNPRTGEVRDLPFTVTPAEEVDALCDRADAASRALAACEPKQRAALLRDMADRLDARADELVAIADRESALGPQRLNGELSRTTAQLRLFARVLEDGHCFEVTIDHPDPSATPPVPDLRRMLVPLGPVAVFGASNFPFAFSAAGGDTASALAAGCAVVVKAHSAHPELDFEVVATLREVAREHGLAQDTIGVVFGRVAGTRLVTHPRIQAVGFTGSESGGRALMDAAAARPEPIPVYAEMGSLNPLIVSPAQVANDAAGTAAGIAGSVTLGHGQFCTKPGLVFVPTGADGDVLVDELTTLLADTPEQAMLSPGIRDAYRANVRRVQGSGVVRALVADREPTGFGSAAAAAVSEIGAASLSEHDSVLIECFGPATLVVRYAEATELVTALARVPASLTLSVLADPAEADLLARLRELGSRRSGRLIFGQYPTGVAVTWAQTHGGPYPAASGLFTSVGTTAIRRFQRPVSYQNWPDEALPPYLQEGNPLGLPRRVDGVLRES